MRGVRVCPAFGVHTVPVADRSAVSGDWPPGGVEGGQVVPHALHRHGKTQRIPEPGTAGAKTPASAGWSDLVPGSRLVTGSRGAGD